ncbi:hypothetical protein [Selenomonas noxia]|jgi:hypothetical protein|uniref:hypothetical protein n=1 Tax=Selenomonas noxia TaxID=135083 RepID=UPI00248AB8CC|nr:hypothetical protein [Selenomonas noxia]
MEDLLQQICKPYDPIFWIITIGLVILFLAGIIGYLKNRVIYTAVLKSAYLHLWLLGVFPLFIFIWVSLLLDGFYSDIFLVASLYWMGISLILFRQYILTFLQSISKECNNPTLQQQWVFMNEMKRYITAYLIGAIYFFSMGTFSLYLLLTK